MSKIILRILGAVFVSLFMFPIEFRFAPGVNTKMVLAAFGVAVAFLSMASNRNMASSKDTFFMVLLSALVSLIGFISTVYNNTSDYAYTTYIVSMLVWLAAAYFCIFSIRVVEGRCSLEVIMNYVIAVSLFQCISAMVIEFVPAFRNWVNSWLYGFGFTTLSDVLSLGRVYGIGATLDVAASRFSAILIMIAVCIRRASSINAGKTWYYIVAFLIVSFIGNIIGRTTTVGMIFGLLYLALSSKSFVLTLTKNDFRIVKWFVLILLVVIPTVTVLYRNNPTFYANTRFAFEGFFSLIETGKWQTTSNDALMTMYIWPDNLKTWIIGDGYFQGAGKDMNFLGDVTMNSYYMRTDVGYCRFIFYFGILGLAAFSLFLLFCTLASIKRFGEEYKLFFWMLLILNFVVWMKVSTDLFVVFAIFMAFIPNEEEMQEVETL